MWRLRALAVLAIASGCHIVFPIEPWADASGNAPAVYSSPGPAPDAYAGYPTSFSITLAADQPGATIYYTTDLSTPDLESPSATTPVRGIMISTTTTVRDFAINEGARSNTTSEKYTIASAAKSTAGFLVTNTTLDGASPVVVASGGSVLSAKADVQIWVQSGCPLCGAQLVYGVDDVDQGCLYEGSPAPYDGVTLNGKQFNVTVPTAPGVHLVMVAHSEQDDCAQAMAKQALVNRPRARIGVIVVK